MNRKSFRTFLLTVFITASVSAVNIYAQTYASVPIDNQVYTILEQAQMRGLCDTLSGARPYSEYTIKTALNQILSRAGTDGRSEIKDEERTVISEALKQFDRKPGRDKSRGAYYISHEGTIPVTMDITNQIDTFVSGGIYNDDSEWGFEWTPQVSLRGDLGTKFSYDFSIFGNASRAVLTQLDDSYQIGYFWYDKTTGTYVEGNESTRYTYAARTIKTYANKAYLPFSFHKKWDGSVYKINNLTAGGLEGWCDDLALGFGIDAEMDASAINNKVQFRFGRIYREWAAMDTGASLVLNSNARPFLGVETTIMPFKHFSISSITGILEFPNAGYVYDENTYNRWYYKTDSEGNKIRVAVDDHEDAANFQNAFSSTLLEADFKYAHVDFGTTAIWPKRFELGYLFPLMDRVFYQNNIGDYDNISLFGNIKLQKPGLGKMWFSLFLDEFNGFSSSTGLLSFNFFETTRDMFAIQAGTKVVVPWLPFATVSCRYTKIQPYCYTHQAVNYTPWYTYYISEAYQNNGECLGYYLPPNSDELNLNFEMMPKNNLTAHFQYQFMRHGCDFGTQAVDGSSLYSELTPDDDDRENKRSYFLHDGAYQWFHVVNIGASYTFKNLKQPLMVYANAGYVFTYFTVIDDDSDANDNESHPYHYSGDDNGVYSSEQGVVLSCGFRFSL